MIGDILNAVINEIKAFLQQQTKDNFQGTVILETDYKKDNLATYSMPLVILDMMDAPEASQYIGGVTRMDWVFGLNSYQLQPDSYVDDNTPFSAELLDIIDGIRQHFSFGAWILPARSDNSNPMAMDDIIDTYGFKFTLTGLSRASQLDQDGLVMGWRIVFDSVAIDDSTDWILPGQTISHIVQTPPDNS